EVARGCMTLIDKLKGEVERYQDKAFLKAAMAICALNAVSAGDESLKERSRLDALTETLRGLHVYDPHKAIAILHEFIADLLIDRRYPLRLMSGSDRELRAALEFWRSRRRRGLLPSLADMEDFRSRQTGVAVQVFEVAERGALRLLGGISAMPRVEARHAGPP